jgi:hypothetical protein
VAFGNSRVRSWFDRHIVSPTSMLAGKKLI